MIVDYKHKFLTRISRISKNEYKHEFLDTNFTNIAMWPQSITGKHLDNPFYLNLPSGLFFPYIIPQTNNHETSRNLFQKAGKSDPGF